MDWRSALDDPEIVKKEWIPALVEATLFKKDRHATYLVSQILLKLCLEKRTSPLMALYQPALVLQEHGLQNLVENQTLEANTLHELLFGSQVTVVRKVIKDMECECLCQRHGGKREECTIGVVVLWRKLLSANLLQPKNIEALQQPLEDVVDALKNPEHLQKGDWWFKKQIKNQPYTREQAKVIFLYLQKIQAHIATPPSPQNLLTFQMRDQVARESDLTIEQVSNYAPDFENYLADTGNSRNTNLRTASRTWYLPARNVLQFLLDYFIAKTEGM